MANNNVDPQLPILSVIEVTSPGPMGPTGPIGPPGSFPSTGSYSLTGSINVSGSFQLDGEVFISGSFTGSYLHIQGTPLATWTVTHNLQSEYPVVVTYDLNKKQMIAQEVIPLNSSSMKIFFPQPESGYAYFSVGTNLAIPNFSNISNSGSNFNPAIIVFGF
jgi:hypothetical protein